MAIQVYRSMSIVNAILSLYTNYIHHFFTTSFTHHVPTHQYDRKMCLAVEMLFFPHCDTHLCTLCDLRPGNFLIVYLPSSFYKFLSTSLPNWLLFPLWNKGPSTDYDMMEEMCGKRLHSKRGLSSLDFVNNMNFEVFITWSGAKFVENL